MLKKLEYICIVVMLLYVAFSPVKDTSAQLITWVADQTFVNDVNSRLPPVLPSNCAGCTLQMNSSSNGMLWGAGGSGGSSLLSYTGGVSVTGNSGNGNDQISNINLNGVLNVKAFGAKGDGVTDDTAAIQSAITSACSTTPTGTVFLPPTPGSSYKISSPIVIPCATKITGSGMTQTKITQNYYGPTVIMQAAETGWKPPLTGSVTRSWATSTTYPAFTVLKDSNGNLQVQETAGTCTSGTGASPNWNTVQGGSTVDNTCSWVMASSGTQLVSGTGTSLDASSPEFFNGAGSGANNATFEVLNPGNLEGSISNLAAFTVEFYVEPFADDGGGTRNYQLITIQQGQSETTNQYALQFILGGASCTGGSNCLTAKADINGSLISVGGSGANDRLTRNVIHHVALSYDGSTLRLFLDGSLSGSTSTTGNWTIPPYSGMYIASQGAQGLQAAVSTPILPAFYDSIRVSNVARYTANFTPSFTKFSGGSNTVFLENFPTGTPNGTIEGTINNNTNAFFPIPTSQGTNTIESAYLGNLQLADNGIWANWTDYSTIENVWNSGTGRTCINLSNEDFQDTITKAYCTVDTPTGITSIAFMFGPHADNNLYQFLNCDGQYSCVGQSSASSSTYINAQHEDAGFTYYAFYFLQSQALLLSPVVSFASTESHFLGDVYTQSAGAPIEIHSGSLTSGAATGAYLVQNGGAPLLVKAVAFSGSVAEAYDDIVDPTQPAVLEDYVIPANTTLTNTGKTLQLYTRQGDQVSWNNNACSAKTTLSAGAGTWSNSCISSTRLPNCRDITANNNFTATVAAGSITFSSGTGSDVIWCTD